MCLQFPAQCLSKNYSTNTASEICQEGGKAESSRRTWDWVRFAARNKLWYTVIEYIAEQKPRRVALQTFGLVF